MNGYDYPDVGGGVNLGKAANAIQPREMAALRNFYPYEGSLRRRGGTPRLTVNGPWQQLITGMHGLKKSTGAWDLIVAGYNAFGRFDPGTQQIITLPPGDVSMGGNGLPWVMFQYKDFGYALRRGAGRMVRIADVTFRAGIARPTTGPTLAEGGAGDLPAGVYRAVVTFRNQQTGFESNPSPESSPLTLGSLKEIDWSDIPVSPNQFVNQRRLWRSLENQDSGVFFLAGVINDNTTTSFTEDVTVDLLGDNVSFDNGLPADDFEIGVVFNERLFASDGRDLWFSEFLCVECFGEDSFLPVEPDDGHKISGLHVVGGPGEDRLIIGKTNKMHILTGNSRANFAVDVLDEEHGCRSHHSMASVNNRLFWYGTGNAVYSWAGSTKEISNPKVKPILEAIPTMYEEYVVGEIVPERNWYVLTVPQEGFGSGVVANGVAEASPNAKVLIYNYREDTWTVFDWGLTIPQEQVELGVPRGAPHAIWPVFDTDGKRLFYTSHYDGHIYRFADEGYGWDFEQNRAITAQLLTRAEEYGAPGYQKCLDQVWLHTPLVSSRVIQLEALVNGVVRSDRSISLAAPAQDWKAFKLPTWRYPGTGLQVRLTYAAAPQLILNAMHFEVGVLQRKPGQPR